MRTFKLVLILTPFILATFITPASAIELGVMGGLNMGGYSTSPAITGQTSNAKSGIVFGAKFATSIVPSLLGLELNLLYTGRKVEFVNTPGAVTYSVAGNWVQIPLMVRLTALPIVKFGAGLSYNLLMGNLHLESNNQAVITSGDYAADSSTMGLKSSDLTIALSIATEFAIAPKIKIFGDFRYDLPLSNVDTLNPTVTTTKFTDLLLMAGVSITL